jgi:hypothetical protein
LKNRDSGRQVLALENNAIGLACVLIPPAWHAVLHRVREFDDGRAWGAGLHELRLPRCHHRDGRLIALMELPTLAGVVVMRERTT